MTSSVKAAQIRTWKNTCLKTLSEPAVYAAKSHLTFAEAKEKGFIEEGDKEKDYVVAREQHIEITLAYIKAKPKTLMQTR